MKLYLLLAAITVTVKISKEFHTPTGKIVTDLATCSGVFVSTDEVLTAAHCVKNGRNRQWIKTNDGVSYPVTIEKTDFVEDLALLRINNINHKYTSIGKEPAIVSNVFTVNSGDGFAGSYGEGKVENIVKYEDEQQSALIEHSIAILHGASGSGLFDSKGRLVGINVMGNGALSLAVNTPTIRHFLASGLHSKTLLQRLLGLFGL